MAKFKKGDICVIVKAYVMPELEGEEVTIIGEPYEYYDNTSNMNVFGYPTDLQVVYNGIEYKIVPAEHQLRLKDAPPDAIVMREYSRLIEKVTGKVPA